MSPLTAFGFFQSGDSTLCERNTRTAVRIAVTGASGNVGTAVLRALRAAYPDAQAVGLSRRRPPQEPPFDGVTWVQVDLASEDSETILLNAFSGVDAVVHLAIAFQPMRDRRYLRRVNVDGTERVARACEAAGVGHLVHLSSGGIYAPGAYGVEVDESWPRTGVEASTYSMDKAAAEDVLDGLSTRMRVARLRPGLISQCSFGSALLRYALPDLVPSSIVDVVPFLPIDRSFVVPAVHSDDVADAVVRVLQRRASGPFNLAAPTPVRADTVADAFGVRIVPTPKRVLSTAVRVGFTAHVLSIHHGWVELAFETPLLNAARARNELGWQASKDGPAVLRDTVRGMQDRAFGDSPPMRKRTISDTARSFLRRGFVSRGRPS